MARQPAGGASRHISATGARIIASVAANVRRLREARDWTQKECADRCGQMSVYQLHLIETGRANFTINVLAQLCEGFGVEPASLFEPTAPLATRTRGRPRKPENATGTSTEEPQTTAVTTEPRSE